jgi:hypothetical protein
LKRQLIFWAVVTFNFYFQSIHPVSLSALTDLSTHSNALLNVLCFIPVCVLVVYVLKIKLLPVIEKKQYLKSVIFFILVYISGTLINYFAAWIYFNFATGSNIASDTSVHRIEVAGWNTRWAVILGIVVMGFGLAKRWLYQVQANLDMLQAKARAEMQAQKSKIHPDWLFRSLEKICGSLAAQSAASTSMILNLSDMLSYSLYDSEVELVPLEQELLSLQHLVSLEQADVKTGFHVRLNRFGDPVNKYITPMSVINKVAKIIAGFPDSQLKCLLELNFTVGLHSLECISSTICESVITTQTTNWKLVAIPQSICNTSDT